MKKTGRTQLLHQIQVPPVPGTPAKSSSPASPRNPNDTEASFKDFKPKKQKKLSQSKYFEHAQVVKVNDHNDLCFAFSRCRNTKSSREK